VLCYREAPAARYGHQRRRGWRRSTSETCEFGDVRPPAGSQHIKAVLSPPGLRLPPAAAGVRAGTLTLVAVQPGERVELLVVSMPSATTVIQSAWDIAVTAATISRRGSSG